MIENAYRSGNNIEQALFNALYEIMLTTPIDRIPVTKILEKAHVSKATFYRKYRDKYDLLNKCYENILEKTLFTFNRGISWRESIYQIYKVIGDNREFFSNAFNSSDCNSLQNFIFDRTLRLEKEILRKNGVDPDAPENSYRLISYVSGGLAITVKWVQDKAEFPLDKLVEIFVENIPNGFQEYFK